MVKYNNRLTLYKYIFLHSINLKYIDIKYIYYTYILSFSLYKLLMTLQTSSILHEIK